jgi:hypothetical protein
MPFAPLTSIFTTALAASLSSSRLFALAVFHAPLVLDLAGFCGIASAASVPLVATLFAAVGLLCLRETRFEPDEKDDHQRREETHAIILLLSC